MTSPATRARWLELAGERRAAAEAADLLDQKREVLLRELHRRLGVEDAVRRRFAEAIARARRAVAEAQVELGGDGVKAAALAVRDAPSIDVHPRSLVGVALPDLKGRFPAARPSWAPGGTCESLDRSRMLFLEALSIGVEFACEQMAVSNLRRALAQTNRRWNALVRVILPGLARELAVIAGALAEEERDDDFRHRRRKGRAASISTR
ncbi:MAG TPA: V-type ATP synthase subunit D [Thermoanaerobaculia bacterium]|nr:V-type ATP synthase subunit D [Thermoanaerobaculia bacterium]